MAKLMSSGHWITTEHGGVVSVNYSYKTRNHRPFSIHMTLSFEPGTVKKDMYVVMSLEGNDLVVNFDPDGSIFNKPALLDADIRGLDLSDVPKDSKAELFYMSGGSYEKIDAPVHADLDEGTLSCDGAPIKHFSIYGFGFVKEE
jgi:hypothetical protein